LDDEVAIVNGDSAFWALVDSSEAASFMTGGKLARAYKRKAEAFNREMEELRFGLSPSAVYFNPTERCNLDCTYCYLPGTMRKTGTDMSPEALCRALEILKGYFSSTLEKGVRPQVVFHGSEPLLVKNAIYRGIDRYGDYFRFGVQTNATLLDEEAMDFFIRHDVVMGISLDAHNKEIADRARKNWSGEGQFDKVASVLERLGDYPGFNVICTVTTANVRSLTKIVEYFHSRRVPVAMLNPVRCTLQGGRDLKPDNRTLARQFIKALDRSYELWQETGRKLVIANFANVLMGIVAPSARRLMCDISPCGGGRCFFAVSATGEVFPCSEFIGMEEFCGGNLFEDDLPAILDTQQFARITTRRVEDIEPCASCAIRHFCGAPCPAEVHSCTGKLNAPSEYCEFYEEQARYAFRVIAEGREDAFLWDGWKEGTEQSFQLNAL
jgi:uncharacterized protein